MPVILDIGTVDIVSKIASISNYVTRFYGNGLRVL